MKYYRTVDGLRIRVASVSRSLVLRFGSEVLAQRWARDLALLDCDVARDVCVVTVTGAHDALDEIANKLSPGP